MDVVFFVFSMGFFILSIDVWFMNEFLFFLYMKWILFWGFGCVGGVSGLVCVVEYCKVYFEVFVFVIVVELCSLIF